MRFDDSLRTVLRFDSGTGAGAQATWRQLVDLAGRGRAPSGETVIERLRMLRPAVPAEVRAASARALAGARADPRLVALFAEDDAAIAAPVLRTVELPTSEWIALLPRLSPPLRSVLRRRRDLDPQVSRALEGFGPIDFALAGPERGVEEALELKSSMIAAPEAVGREPDAQPRAETAISELVARIEAFRNRQSGKRHAPPPEAQAQEMGTEDRFRFETDGAGTLIGVDGVERGALLGLSLLHSGLQGAAQLDGVAPGAFRRRSRFDDARLEVGGSSSAAGSWRLSAVPVFEPMTGRFTGYRGVGRRPRVDESAGPIAGPAPSVDSLRLLIHELRTPTSAILGFAEIMTAELLGPLPAPHRARAAAIRREAGGLLVAIEDVDTAARIDMRALELRPGVIAVRPLVERVARDLAPLASLRVVDLLVDGDQDADALADDRAVERLVGRLLATLVAAGERGEALRASVRGGPAHVELAIDRPRALRGLAREVLLALDDDGEGAPLLGTGFALRLARKLALELGGALEFGLAQLTLRLPAALARPVEHATTI